MYLYNSDPDLDPIEGELPNDQDWYLAFFTTLPDDMGLGGVEAAIPRIQLGINAWVNVSSEKRVNIRDYHVLCPIDVEIVGEGIYDQAVGGTLVAFGATQLADAGERTLPLRVDQHHIGHLPGDLQVTFTGNDAIFDVYTHDYQRVIDQLYPFGPAWNREVASNLQQLILSQSIEFSRIAYRLELFRIEINPGTSEEFLTDWEQFLALPECGQSGLSLSVRQQQALSKLTALIEPTPQFFIDLAESLGYTGVTITLLGDPFTVGDTVGDSLGGGPWVFTWQLSTNETTANDALLMCLVNLYNPLHTTVIFDLGP